MFCRFDSRIIAAPAVVYRGTEENGEKVSNVLVAGHSLEINATSDIDLHISLPQFTLLQDIVEDTSRYSGLSFLQITRENIHFGNEQFFSGVERH